MDAVLDANLALIQVKQNSDMRKISAWVGIGAALTMVAGIYGMNFENLPELELKYVYFVVLGVVSGSLFGLFRKNDWRLAAPAALAEAITHRAHCLNQVGMLFAKLGAQTTHVNVHGARTAVVLIAPHA